VCDRSPSRPRSPPPAQRHELAHAHALDTGTREPALRAARNLPTGSICPPAPSPPEPLVQGTASDLEFVRQVPSRCPSHQSAASLQAQAASGTAPGEFASAQRVPQLATGSPRQRRHLGQGGAKGNVDLGQRVHRPAVRVQDGPTFRWRSLSQAMSIDGPEMASSRPTAPTGIHSRGQKGGQDAGQEGPPCQRPPLLWRPPCPRRSSWALACRQHFGLVFVGVDGLRGAACVFCRASSSGRRGAFGHLFLDHATNRLYGAQKACRMPIGFSMMPRDCAIPVVNACWS